MAWALQFDNSYLDLPVSDPFIPLVGHFEIDVRLFLPSSGATSVKVFDSNNSTGRLDVNITLSNNLDSRSYCHFEVDGSPATSVSRDVWFNLKVIRDGTDSDQADKRVGKIGARYNNVNRGKWDLQFIDFNVASIQTAHLDATASDHSNTGQQPVLIDTVGVYDGTGVNFPTDGSAWIDLGGGGNTGAAIYTMGSITPFAIGNVGEPAFGGASFTADDLTLSAFGTIGDNPTGTAAYTMDGLALSSVGFIGLPVFGSALFTNNDFSVISNGIIGAPVVGGASVLMGDLVLQGEGDFAIPVTGSAVYTMGDFVLDGRESTGGGMFDTISVIPIEIEEINVIPIEVIKK